MISESAQTRISDAPSLRQNVLGILAAAFLAGVLIFRFTLPPHSWRKIDAMMTMEELQAKLGEPTSGKSNEILWREKRILGDWELTAHIDEQSGNTYQNHFRFLGKWEE